MVWSTSNESVATVYANSPALVKPVGEGSAISQQNLAKIFDPYFSTKEQGSGLGLTISYSIVKKHDGHISVKSVEGEGTSFTIYMPACTKKAESEVTEERNKDEKSLHKLEKIKGELHRHSQYRELAQLVVAYGGNFDKPMRNLVLIAAKAPEYTLMDYYRMLGSMNRGGGPMHKDGEMSHINFIEQIPSVDVPVFFLISARDYNTPLQLVQEYYEAIDAPEKAIIVFENSAHVPNQDAGDHRVDTCRQGLYGYSIIILALFSGEPRERREWS